MLDTIHTKLIDLIIGISVIDGYFISSSDINQEDFAKVTFPLHNIYLVSNDRVETNTYSGLNSVRYISRWMINIYDKLGVESSNSLFDIEPLLSKHLDDFKRAIALNPTLDGTVQGIYYLNSTRPVSGVGSDIYIPKYISINIEIPYISGTC